MLNFSTLKVWACPKAGKSRAAAMSKADAVGTCLVIRSPWWKQVIRVGEAGKYTQEEPSTAIPEVWRPERGPKGHVHAPAVGVGEPDEPALEHIGKIWRSLLGRDGHGQRNICSPTSPWDSICRRTMS